MLLTVVLALTTNKSNNLAWRLFLIYLSLTFIVNHHSSFFLRLKPGKMRHWGVYPERRFKFYEFKSNRIVVISEDQVTKEGLSRERSRCVVPRPPPAPNLQRLGWLAPSTVQRHLIPAFLARRGRASLVWDPVPWQDTRGVNYFHWLAVLKQKAPTKTFDSNLLVAIPKLPPA